MALPSTRLPKELEEEAAARVQEAKRQKLVFRTSKVDIFRKTMADWYKNLPNKKKLRLTPKDLKRKAVSVCFANCMVYDTLPLDWVTELKTKSGLKLYEKKQRTDKKTPSGDAAKPGTSKAASSVNQPDPTKRKKTRYSELNASTATATDGKSTDKEVAGAVSTPSTPKVAKKRFLDLSTDPPPPYWLKAYAEGKVLPRVLTVHSTDDTNILFYDYCPKLKDSFGREVKLQPQPRNNMSYLAELNLFSKDTDSD